MNEVMHSLKRVVIGIFLSCAFLAASVGLAFVLRPTDSPSDVRLAPGHTVSPTPSHKQSVPNPPDPHAPPSVTGFPRRSDRRVPAGGEGIDYYAPDGAHLALVVRETDEPIETGVDGTRHTRIGGRSALTLQQSIDDREITWVGWRQDNVNYLVWCYPPNGQSRLSSGRVNAALRDVVLWADAHRVDEQEIARSDKRDAQSSATQRR